MQPTIPNTRDFEIKLKIVRIDGIEYHVLHWKSHAHL
jgi:hypothetical protein